MRGTATAQKREPAFEDTPRTSRGYIGAAVRSALEFIEQRGLTEKIRAHASPRVLAQMDRPPGMLTWQDSAVLDELETLIARHAGRDACVALGLHAGRKLGGSLIAPVLKFAMQIFGQTPATLLGNLDRFYPMATRGLSYGYEALSSTTGIVIATCEGPNIPPALFDVIRGNLAYLFELSGHSGTIASPEVQEHTDARAVVRYRATWSA